MPCTRCSPSRMTSGCRRGATVSSSRRWATELPSSTGLLDCATANEEGKPPGAAVCLHAPTRTISRGGWRLLVPHSPSNVACAPLPCQLSLSLPVRRSLPLRNRQPPFLLDAYTPHPWPFFSLLVDPRNKGASATLRADSGRLASWIGRFFETASRVDIALVTNEKVESTNVNASTDYAYDRPVYHGERTSVSSLELVTRYFEAPSWLSGIRLSINLGHFNDRSVE